MLFVGDDWAEDHHDVEVVDEAGRVLTRRRLSEGLEGVTRLHALIAEQMPDDWADLAPGEAAGRVKVVQCLLHEQGYYNRRINGVYTVRTQRAVQAWQAR